MAAKSGNRYIRYYTTGSAARKLAPQVTEFPQAKPRVRKASRVRYYIDPVTALAVVNAVFMAVCMFIGMHQLSQVKAQQAAMSEYVHILASTNEELSRHFNEKLDLEKIENSARNMGMIPASQVSHVTIDISAD